MTIHGPGARPRGERCFLAAFGVLLTGVGIVALAQDHLATVWRLSGGFCLVLLGANALVCAWRGRTSWLSRLGPWP